MPKEGWRAITISGDIYEKAEKFMLDHNAERGMREIRSMAHLVEMAVREYLEKRSKP